MHDLYTHLRSHGFLKGHNVSPRLAKFSRPKLASLLESYIDLARKRPIVFRADLGATEIYPDSRGTGLPISIIRQLAIYARRIYLHDPLLNLAYEWQQLDHNMPLLVKYKTREERTEYFKRKLDTEIEELLKLEPLVEAGIIHVAPTELTLFKRDPKDLYIDDFYGSSTLMDDATGRRKTIADLSPQLKKYCEEKLVVFPAAFVNEEPTILDGEGFFPRNMIATGFADDPSVHKWYQLFDILPTGKTSSDEKAGMNVQMYFDAQHKKTVDPGMFKNWVEGSKYKTVEEILDRLQNDVVLSAMAGAKFITDFPSSRDIALIDLNPASPTSSSKVVTALLKFDLPYFDRVDFSSIAKARQDEVAFEEFRIALDKAFREIDSLPQTQEFQNRVSEVYDDLLIAPIANIQRQMKILQRNLFLSAAILLGSLAATFVTQGNTLVTAASIYAATEVAKMYKEEKAEEDKIKQLPSFFYWELTRR